MNILIVGNGFDLSHYLPTKYDHFMDVMAAIEGKDTGGLPEDLENKKLEDWLKQIDGLFEYRKDMAPPPHHMKFEELFNKTRDPYFIGKTKEYYLTENIEICAKDVLKLQYRLEMNRWYKYFKNHVEEIKTWIDFEQKIETVLVALAQCISDIEKIHNLSEIYVYLDFKSNKQSGIKEKFFNILDFFELWDDDEYVIMATLGANVKSTRNNLNAKFCYGEKLENGLNPASVLDFLYKQLEEFITIFDLYLELIVSKLQLKCSVDIVAEHWLYPDKIFSFNYTNTYQRIHDSVTVEYLHGSHGEHQNIVLGISELEEESLKKIKAYGFTKYHQKLFKDTDYLFLDEYKNKIKLDSRKINKLETDNFYAPLDIDEQRKECIEIAKLHINFSIWGHSLDISDKDYIIDLFSLNDDMDRNVRVVIYHYDKPAKFSLLNNLLAILGKDKVEQWMKNKWLEFKPNPEVKFEVDSNLEEAS